MTDPFVILGLTRESSEDDINKAFKKLAKTCHPDLYPDDPKALARFKEISTARDDAIDIKQGKNKNNFGSSPDFEDILRRSGFGGFSGFGTDDFFRDVFGMHRQQYQKNHDLDTTCQITLEDAFNGRDWNVQLHFNNQVRNIPVKIPVGIDNGNRIRVPNAGDDRISSIKPGDLYVNVRVLPHEKFTRQGINLFHMVDIDVFDLLCGKTLEIEGIDKKKLEVTVPPSFNPTMKLRMMGQGMPVVHGKNRGDLYIGLNVQYPTLNIAQIDMIRRIKDLK